LRLAVVAGAVALAALIMSELLQRRAVARVSGLA
jgi:heme exporter protein D